MDTAAATTAVRRARPMMVAAAGATAAMVFVLDRLHRMAHGDISKFVVAGRNFTDRAQAGGHLFVWRGDGYDGQYYWRLAVDPTNLRVARAHGVVFDYPLRAGRMSYTTLAWVFSLGHQRWTALALVLVNLLALTALVWAGACLAVQSGRSAWYGLLAAGATGLLFSLARDCNEVVMAAGVVVGIAALRNHRRAAAAIAWSVAVLAHEQALYVVGAYALVRLVPVVRRRARLGLDDLVWAAPIAAFALWQSLAALQVGQWPVLTSGSASVAAPLVGISRQVMRAVHGEVHSVDLWFIPELLVVALTVIAVVRARRDVPNEDRWMLLALALGVALSLSLSYNVWMGPAELRQMSLVPTLAAVLLIVSKRRIPVLVMVAVGAMWFIAAWVRVFNL